MSHRTRFWLIAGHFVLALVLLLQLKALATDFCYSNTYRCPNGCPITSVDQSVSCCYTNNGCCQCSCYRRKCYAFGSPTPCATGITNTCSGSPNTNQTCTNDKCQ